MAHRLRERRKRDLVHNRRCQCDKSEGRLINEASILTNEEFKEAIDNRATRIACYHYESHSKNFFSAQTASDIVSYFEQTLGYNGGELGDSSASPLAADNIVFFWREALNFAATLSMILFLFPLTALF